MDPIQIVPFYGICFDEDHTASSRSTPLSIDTVANLLLMMSSREKSILCYDLMESLQIFDRRSANTMRFLHSAGVVHRV